MNAPPPGAKIVVSNKSVPCTKKQRVLKSREEAAKVFFSDAPKPPNKTLYKRFKDICITDHQGDNRPSSKMIHEEWTVIKSVKVKKIAPKDRTRYMGLRLLALEQEIAERKAYIQQLASWCKELDDAADCHLNWLLYEVDDTNFLDLKTSIDLLEQRVEKHWIPSFPRNHHVALSAAKKRLHHLQENGYSSKLFTYLRKCDDHALLQHCNDYAATTFHTQQTLNHVNAELQNMSSHKDELLREATIVANALPIAIVHYMELQMQQSMEGREVPEQGMSMEFCRTGISPFIFSLAFEVSFPLPQGTMMPSCCIQIKLNGDGTSYVCSDIFVSHDSAANKLVACAKYYLRRH